MKNMDLNERINLRVTKNNDCLEWNGSKNNAGYGYISICGIKNPQLVHRVIYEYHNGKIPKNMLIMHTCDNPKCCNIEHLKLGTNLTNAQDKVSKGRCGQTGAKGSKHGLSKLNEEEASFIKYNNKLKTKELMIMFNVSESTILYIKKNKIWKHI